MNEEIIKIGLSGDTLIEMPDRQEKIKNLVGKKNFWVYSYNISLKKIILSMVKRIFLVAPNVEVSKIVLSNGGIITGAFDNEFIMRDGTYKKIGDMKKHNRLAPFYRASDEFTQIKINKSLKKGVLNPFYTRKIVSVEPAGVEDVYSMEVENNHNFAIDAGVISFDSEFKGYD